MADMESMKNEWEALACLVSPKYSTEGRHPIFFEATRSRSSRLVFDPWQVEGFDDTGKPLERITKSEQLQAGM